MESILRENIVSSSFVNREVMPEIHSTPNSHFLGIIGRVDKGIIGPDHLESIIYKSKYSFAAIMKERC